jgi:choline monooxygenase
MDTKSEAKPNVSLPSVNYRSPSIFEKEKQTIFAKEWQLVALETELPNVGSYVTKTIVGFPIFVIKTADGYRGYHNVCRHRGNLILTKESGENKLDFVTCRYHSWSFNVKDGSVKSAPSFEKDPSFKKEDWPMYSIKVEVWEAAIFVNLDEKSVSLKEWLGNIVETVAKYKMGEFTDANAILHPAKCNWKTFIEGYQECYHCGSIHVNLRQVYDLGKYVVNNYKNYSHHVCPRQESSDSTASELMGGHHEDPGVWIWRYPNLCISCYPRGNFLMTVDPVSPDQTEIHTWYRYPKGTTEAEKADFSKYIIQNNIEDLEMCEQIQKNLNAGKFTVGPLHPNRENGVIFFHDLIRASLATYKSEKATVSVSMDEKPHDGCGCKHSEVEF